MRRGSSMPQRRTKSALAQSKKVLFFDCAKESRSGSQTSQRRSGSQPSQMRNGSQTWHDMIWSAGYREYRKQSGSHHNEAQPASIDSDLESDTCGHYLQPVTGTRSPSSRGRRSVSLPVKELRFFGI